MTKTTLAHTGIAVQQSHNSSCHEDNYNNVTPLIENQDENNTDNSSETSESQYIDINSTNINNHVLEDSDSQSIEIDHISFTNAVCELLSY